MKKGLKFCYDWKIGYAVSNNDLEENLLECRITQIRK